MALSATGLDLGRAGIEVARAMGGVAAIGAVLDYEGADWNNRIFAVGYVIEQGLEFLEDGGGMRSAMLSRGVHPWNISSRMAWKTASR